ncbi:MAG: four helix bundle protein [Bacteroidota bacterium]
MHNLRELKIWEKALELADAIYEVTDKFPENEKFGITNQMRRAAVSVSSNIAEGAGRNSNKEFNHFIGISNGSIYELRFQLELSIRRNYIDIQNRDRLLELMDHLIRMNYNLQIRMNNSVDRSNRSQYKP